MFGALLATKALLLRSLKVLDVAVQLLHQEITRPWPSFRGFLRWQLQVIFQANVQVLFHVMSIGKILVVSCRVKSDDVRPKDDSPIDGAHGYRGPILRFQGWTPLVSGMMKVANWLLMYPLVMTNIAMV
jgi:hypothetical protein